MSELDRIPENHWKLAVQRERIIAPLALRAHVKVCEVEEAAGKLNLGPAMVFRLIARYRREQRTSVLIPETPGRKAGSRVLGLNREKLIEAAIKDFYLCRERPTLAALHREVAIACRKAGLPVASYKALHRRVTEYDRRTLLKKRFGAKQANQDLSPVQEATKVTTPLALMQIDHTLADVIVVDEVDRKPIGRPWLTVAIDVATRMVPGFHLSLEAPCATSVALALSMAVLPKERMLARLGFDLSWPCYGLPQRLYLDNAREFQSKALKHGCQEYGIEIGYRPPGQPHFGGHIERLIGTMMGEVHLLPGTTFSSVADRGNYKSVQAAVMTMRELEAWLVAQIAGIYHVRRHRGLNRAPIEAWSQAMKSQPAPRLPVNQQRFYIDFLPYERRTVRRDGIRMFNIFYWTDSLTTLLHQSNRTCVVHYDPRDLSRVYVRDRHNEWIEVPYRTKSNVPATLEEQRWASRKLRSSKHVVDETALFEAIATRRQIVEEARKKTMRARRSGQKTAYALQGQGSEPTLRSVDPGNDSSDPIQPYPVEVWE